MIEYTVKVDGNGSKSWYLNGKLHREDGPAIEYSSGFKAWYLNNARHREDGPAIEDGNGFKEWWLNGELHREDGPAVEHFNGSKAWYLNAELLTEKEFNVRMNHKKSCNGKIIMVDGKQYKLTEVE